MLKRINKWFFRIKQSLPENKVRADYYEMLQQLKKLESQVEKRASQLEMAKSSFLRNLYHEIRTPLNAILGFTNLISNKPNITQREKEDYQALIQNSSVDFLKIMDDIIQASLLEAGMINVNNDECKLDEILDEVYSYCSMRRHLLEKNNVALLKNIPSVYKDVVVTCDKYYLLQILSQLVENALKFSEKGSVEFGFYQKNKNIEFFVKDSGSGTLKGKEKFIFSRFSKLDITNNAKNGLGLGLSNCKNLVELMNGKIWYNSTPGKGTCFYFSIPFVVPERLVAANTESEPGFFESVLRGNNSLAV